MLPDISFEPEVDSTELKRQAWASVGVPIFALVSVVLVMALALLTYFAKEQDRVFEANSKQLVTNEIYSQISSVGNLSSDWGIWQAAYDQVTLRWNNDWVSETFFTDLADQVWIVRDGETRYSWVAPQIPANDATISAILRKTYLTKATPQKQNLVFQSNGTLFLLASHPIMPEKGIGPIRDNIVLIKTMDSARLMEIGRILGLQNLRLAPNGKTRRGQVVVSLELQGITLIWDHARPGSAAFSKLAALVLSWVSLVGMLAWVVARHQVKKQISLASAQQASLEASRLKSQFLFTMSHELRTPLNSIIGYSALLEEDLAKAPEMASPDDARRIRGAADHLLGLINEVLDLSAIESGKFTLNKIPVDVGVILEEVAEKVRPLGAKQGTSVSLSMD